MNEIETIFCKLLKCDRSNLYLNRHGSLLHSKEYHKLEGILKKRIMGEPLQYLLGDTEFMGLTFKVRPGVFIPRPETEIVVEEVLKRAPNMQPPVSILDIGTGSGNIAIVLASFLNNVEICAVDISDICLSMAKANARLNHVNDRITFYESDIFSCFYGRELKFDFIISNPPYISGNQYESLPQDVRREPSLALLAQDGGLSFYSRIQEGAREFLKENGYLILEISTGRIPGISRIFSDRSLWKDLSFVRDYNGIERVAIIRRA